MEIENYKFKWVHGCLALVLLTFCLWPVGCACGWYTKATNVVMQQIDPQRMLSKYEWFKDVAATLDSKRASLKAYEARFAAMEADYKSIPRSQWPRDDREQFNLWQSEMAGLKASYNLLAADYNSQMSKINWAFCNRGDLPQGASDPLPREFKPYLEK